jgi:hypothetical protein
MAIIVKDDHMSAEVSNTMRFSKVGQNFRRGSEIVFTIYHMIMYKCALIPCLNEGTVQILTNGYEMIVG